MPEFGFIYFINAFCSLLFYLSQKEKIIFNSLLPEKLEVHFVKCGSRPYFKMMTDQFESTVIRQELYCKSNKTKTQLITSDCLYLNEVLPSH